MDLLIGFLVDYGGFILKTFTLVFALVFLISGLSSAVAKAKEHREKYTLKVENMNEFYQDLKLTLQHSTEKGPALKKLLKEEKKKRKEEDKSDTKKPNVYLIDFEGDVKASDSDSLANEINAVLMVADEKDEVVVKVNSPGGLVNTYGLCASQLKRIRDQKIRLTVCVDEVAASGGYLMACIAEKILAAPFSIIGSIGVVSSVPNFHRVLKKNDIDYELHTSGEYKRTLTMFGENSEESRKKFREQLDMTHELFKKFVKDYRPQVEVDRVATGEFWYGYQAVEKQLVDEIKTSDEYLMELSKDHSIHKVSYEVRESVLRKLKGPLERLAAKANSFLRSRWAV